LGLDGDVPDHSTFSKNRHGRFRESDLLRKLFETVVGRCMKEGIVGGDPGFSSPRFDPPASSSSIVPIIVDGHYPRAGLRALSPYSASRPGGLRRRLTQRPIIVKFTGAAIDLDRIESRPRCRQFVVKSVALRLS
jgi:Transposase domain (DUF772)